MKLETIWVLIAILLAFIGGFISAKGDNDKDYEKIAARWYRAGFSTALNACQLVDQDLDAVVEFENRHFEIYLKSWKGLR